MGIKDKVINILFDDEEAGNASSNNIRRTKEEKSSPFVDTTPIFIDANPTKKQTKTEDPIKEIVKEIKEDDGYRMTENISPIFGVQRNDGKTKKSSQKNKTDSNFKMYDGLMNAGTNTNTSYSSVIISPIFGPIENKPTRKNPTRTVKKTADPFKRSIDDTGEFKTAYVEKPVEDNEDAINFDQEAPSFDDAKEEKVVAEEKLGDTDRLSKISDRINQIKNEAASIYSHEHIENIETRKENKVETHSTISDLIHNFQKQDDSFDFSILNKKKDEPVENTVPEYTEAEQEEIVDDIPLSEIINEEKNELVQEVEEKPVVQEVINEEIPQEPEAPLFEEHNDYETKEEGHKIEDSTQLSLEDTFNHITERLDDNSSQSSIDDIFEDDGDDGKDLFSDLFGDE